MVFVIVAPSFLALWLYLVLHPDGGVVLRLFLFAVLLLSFLVFLQFLSLLVAFDLQRVFDGVDALQRVETLIGDLKG